MPFALIIIGLLMIITGGRGTYAQFGSQVASEFQGQNSFTYQMIALGAVGALGYIPELQTISRWALALILLVVLIGNKGSTGFYSQFQAALQSGPTAPQPIGSTSTTSVTAADVAIAQSGGTVTGTATVPGIFDNILQNLQSINPSGSL